MNLRGLVASSNSMDTQSELKAHALIVLTGQCQYKDIHECAVESLAHCQPDRLLEW